MCRPPARPFLMVDRDHQGWCHCCSKMQNPMSEPQRFMLDLSELPTGHIPASSDCESEDNQSMANLVRTLAEEFEGDPQGLPIDNTNNNQNKIRIQIRKQQKFQTGKSQSIFCSIRKKMLSCWKAGCKSLQHFKHKPKAEWAITKSQQSQVQMGKIKGNRILEVN